MAGKTPYVLHYSGSEVQALLDKTEEMPEPADISTKADLQAATAALQEEIDEISGTAEPLSNEQLDNILAKF